MKRPLMKLDLEFSYILTIAIFFFKKNKQAENRITLEWFCKTKIHRCDIRTATSMRQDKHFQFGKYSLCKDLEIKSKTKPCILFYSLHNHFLTHKDITKRTILKCARAPLPSKPVKKYCSADPCVSRGTIVHANILKKLK